MVLIFQQLSLLLEILMLLICPMPSLLRDSFFMKVKVELEQGIEMLNIFKSYGNHSSILDDFNFYEERQKAMQERKSRQPPTRSASPPEQVVIESHNPVSLPNDSVKKLTKSFAEAVLLSGNDTEDSEHGKVVSTSTGHGR